MSSHWYQNFFHGIALDMWRRAVTPEQTREEVDFLTQELAIDPGGHLLDVPCGNGRHAIEFASLGFRVTGVDLSSEFIAEARGEAERRRVAIEFVESDMRTLPAGPFDGAFCFGNSFGYLEEGGAEDFFAAVAHSLKPGARFVLDTSHAAESLLPNLPTTGFYELGDLTMAISNQYDPLNSLLRTEFVFTRNGTEDHRVGEVRTYTVAELGRMGSRAGLRRIAAWSSTTHAPYQPGMRRLLLVYELSR